MHGIPSILIYDRFIYSLMITYRIGFVVVLFGLQSLPPKT